jgi:hypothetical protein
MDTGEQLAILLIAAFITLGALFLIIRSAVLGAVRDALAEHRKIQGKTDHRSVS